MYPSVFTDSAAPNWGVFCALRSSWHKNKLSKIHQIIVNNLPDNLKSVTYCCCSELPIPQNLKPESIDPQTTKTRRPQTPAMKRFFSMQRIKLSMILHLRSHFEIFTLPLLSVTAMEYYYIASYNPLDLMIFIIYPWGGIVSVFITQMTKQWV